jgi:hypothetical protein
MRHVSLNILRIALSFHSGYALGDDALPHHLCQIKATDEIEEY